MLGMSVFLKYFAIVAVSGTGLLFGMLIALWYLYTSQGNGKRYHGALFLVSSDGTVVNLLMG